MNTLKLFLVFASFCLIPAAYANLDCHYQLDATTIGINWTAFKTSQRVPVQGAFTEVTLVGDLDHGKTVGELLTDMGGEIEVTGADKIHTANPGRDQTIYQKFFSLFKQKAFLVGQIKKLTGDNSSGVFLLDLTMNKKTLAVPMKYTRSDEGDFLAQGGIDLADFGLNGALDSLHHACKALHMGPDGISKTWPIVEIRLQAKILKKCI